MTDQPRTDSDTPPADPAAGDPEAALDRETASFRQAIDELETILRRIESEEVDIDRLAAEVARATELVDLCRTKLRRAEVQVTEIVQKLDDDGDGNSE